MADVKVIGADQVARGLEDLAEQAEQLDSLRSAGEGIRADLAALSPRRTGRLAQSWQVARTLNKISISSDLIYAPVQNYGGYHGIEGKHFIEKAADRAEQSIEQDVTAELDGLIARL